MAGFSRRKFLQWSAAGFSTCALGLLGGPARAAAPPRKVLEIFLRGGCAPWRGFYAEESLFGAEPVWDDFAPNSAVTTGLAGFHLGSLGRAAHPLAATSLVRRCRVMCMQHDLEPHEAATPFAITGTRLGAQQIGFGTAVNATLLDPLASVVIDTGDPIARTAATTLGSRLPMYRPLVLKMGDSTFLHTLERTVAKTTNEIKSVLSNAYAARLKPANSDVRVRSLGFDSYESSLERMRSSDEVLGVIGALDLSAPEQPNYNDNATRRGLRAAVSLLSGDRVKYACVIDTGVHDNYDTHNDVSDAPTVQAGNLWSVCDEIAQQVRELDRLGIMVVLNTEFGRLDYDGDSGGSEHWPGGYVAVLLGDAIPSTKTRGSIDVSGTKLAVTDTPSVITPNAPYSPADLRAVLAARMGVLPSLVVDLDTLAAPGLTDQNMADTLNLRILR